MVNKNIILLLLLATSLFASKWTEQIIIGQDGQQAKVSSDSALHVTIVDSSVVTASIVDSPYVNIVDSAVVVVADTPAVKLMGEYTDDSLDIFRIDRSTNAATQIAYEHHEIHSGSHYFYEGYESLDADDTLDFGVQTPDNAKWTHIVWVISSSLGSIFQVREGATITWNGTDQTSYNSDRNSSNTSNWVNFEKDPTPTALGTLLAETQLGTATNANQGLPGDGGREREIILKQNTVYLFRIISLNNSNVVTYLSEHYEHTNKH